jgi:hypothetical protein
MMYSTQTTPQPPAPGNPDEARRVEATRHRYAMMEGKWRPLLEARLEEQLGSVRRAAWGVPDTTQCVLRTVCTELATLYDAEPDVRHAQFAPSPNLDRLVGSSGSIARSGLWAQMTRFQALTIALREMWMRVEVVDGRLVYRPVPPHMTIAEADPARPTVPTMFGELRLRHMDRKHVWTFDLWDIRDEGNPSYRVVEALDGWQFGRDLTLQLHGATYEGIDYPSSWRRANGTPIIPAQLYHASNYGDRLFDPFANHELVEGTLQMGVLYSFLTHCIRDASFPQRYAVGVRVAGTDSVDGGTRASRSEVTTDPTTILMFDPIAETSQPMIGQYQAGADVEKLEAVIAAVAHRLATDAGLAPSELQRTSGSARSGYAISLSQEGKRVAQRRYVMQFRAADEALVGLSAILYNRWSEANSEPTNYPEGGFSVLYREIPLSGDELSARRDHVVTMLEKGLMTKVDALRYFGSLSEQDAVAQLAAIKAEAPPATLEEGARTGEAAPERDVSHAEAMAEAVDELRASEEALDGLLEAATGEQRDILRSVLESLREARGYLTGQEVEAERELPGEVESESSEEPQEASVTTEAAPDESIAAAATAAGQPASAVALNGAQVQAAQGIIASVAKGELPRETGVQMLIQFFSIPPEQAETLMGPVGRSFTIEPTAGA